jgi:hypothetical protein
MTAKGIRICNSKIKYNVMELTDAQKETVAVWFADGASLDEIQKRIKAEFGVHMTYLDVRLLVAELPQPEEKAEGEGAEGEEKAEEVGNKTPRTPKTPRTEPPDNDREFADGPDGRPGDDGAPIPEDGENADSNEAQAVVAPTVTIDALMLPGTIASGDVTFSDGKAGKWYLDQMGRLGIGNLPEGYRPSPTDAALFQQQLMGLLQAKGLC